MATTNAVQNEQLREILQCSICHDIYVDPRALPCLHTFCSKCIAKWYKYKQPGMSVACPLCRKVFDFPDSGINGLPKNFFIENLLSLNEAFQKKKEMCEICEQKNVSTMFCVECEQSYCESCCNAHSKMKISSSHNLLSFEELESRSDIQSKSQSIFCDEHRDKKIELYCFEDKKAICIMCYVNEHSSHSCKELKKVAEGFRVDLRQDSLTISKAISEFDENLVALNASKVTLFDQVTRTETEICDEADHFKQLIETCKNERIAELRDIRTKNELEIDKMCSRIAKSKSLFTEIANYTNELLKRGTDVDIIRETEGLNRRAKELASMEKGLENFREIHVVFSRSSLTEFTLGKVTTDLLPSVAHMVQGNIPITSLALMNDALFVTREQVSQVSVYQSTTLQFQRSISVHQLGDPSGIAASLCNQLLFISDAKNYCVHRVDRSNDDVVRSATWKVGPFQPHGISVDHKGNVLVVCGMSASQVSEYTPTGTFVRAMSYGSSMWQAVETKKETLIASLCCPQSKHAIVELSMSRGGILCCYSSEADNMNGPRSLVVNDSNGNVLVADCNNDRIQVLDSLLKTARTLQLPSGIALNRPFAICYDESRGRLFVGEWEGACRLLAIDHVIV